MKCVKNNNISACKNFIVEQNGKLYSIITKQVVTKILKLLKFFLCALPLCELKWRHCAVTIRPMSWTTCSS